MFNQHLPALPPLPKEISELLSTKVDISKKYNLPKEVTYCKECVISNQRPRIGFSAGVCNACNYWHSKSTSIDWAERERQLKDLCDRHRRSDGRFDVLVPSSGGKDSVYVAHLLKHKYGMNPLTMTWAPHLYTQIGWINMQSKIHSGFDNILLSPNGLVHRQMTRLATILIGDPFQPFIYGQTYVPIRVAANYGIDLIFDGENGEAEYGGDATAESAIGFSMKQANDYWLSDFPLERWTEFGFTPQDLEFYKAPDARQQEQGKNIERHFASYYLNWEPQKHYFYCSEHTGFESNPYGRSEGTYSKYASLDDVIDPFHYYFALLKFGIARCTSDAAHEIREGLIDRDEAVALVKKYDAEYPKDETLDAFLRYTDLTHDQLKSIEHRWRNLDLWHKDGVEWKLNRQVSF